jgi:hypothetical protein
VGDHTAIRYTSDFGSEHPLAAAYARLTTPEFVPSKTLPTPDVLKRNDPAWEICLIKEVHALLGTEALLRVWHAPTVFVLRDPVFVIDSLFAAQTADTAYLTHELRGVRAPEFQRRFWPGQETAIRARLDAVARESGRRRKIIEKLVVVELLQGMFRALAREFPSATTLNYEHACASPQDHLRAAADHLSIPWGEGSESFLRKTMRARGGESADPYSVYRDTTEQLRRPPAFLTHDEVNLCRYYLREMRAALGCET